MSDNHSEPVLDVTGLLCPLPVLKARKLLQSMTPGAVLHVTATDPMSAIDMPHFCNEQGHQLLSQDSIGQIFHFRIKRK